LVLLLLGQVGRDDLEVVLLELVDDLVGRGAPLVRANRADVPSVTFSRTCFTKSWSIPTLAKEPPIAPIPAPSAAPRRGIKKSIPNRKPQKAPQPAPAPAVLCS